MIHASASEKIDPPLAEKKVDPLPWAEGACPPMNLNTILNLSLRLRFFQGKIKEEFINPLYESV